MRYLAHEPTRRDLRRARQIREAFASGLGVNLGPLSKRDFSAVVLIVRKEK